MLLDLIKHMQINVVLVLPCRTQWRIHWRTLDAVALEAFDFKDKVH